MIIGIDIAKRNHEATAIDDAGQILGRITFANSNAGAAKLLDFIARLKSEDEKVVFGMEATGHYWLAIYSYLVERDFDVCVINPIQSDSLRNLFIRKTKNDQRDSFIIAEIIRFGRYTETQLSDENTLALRQLCRYRTSLVDQTTELKLQAIAVLDQIFPEYETLFANIFGVSSKALLMEYTTPDDMLSVSAEKLAEVIDKTSRGRFKLEKAKEIQEKARNSFGITIAIDAFAFQLRQLIEQIKFIEEHIKEIEDHIKTYFDTLDSCLPTIPGIGMITAAIIESEIGDINRFAGPEKLVAFVGIDPSVKQSGDFIGSQNRMSKRGSPHLRRAIWQAAVRAVQVDPVLKAFFEKKRSEGKAYGTAIGAVARKLTYIIFVIMRDKKTYVPMA